MKSNAQGNFNLLHSKSYGFYWLSSLFSNIGTWMQQVAQPWLILSLGYPAFWVGLDSFVMNAPGWIFTLIGGTLADRYDRKKIVLLCQTFQLLIVGVLFILILLGKINIWIILASSLLIGISDSLSMPAFQSIIPSIVKKEEVSRAVALNSIQFNLSRVLGPLLAGVMISGYGISVCYGMNLISFLPFFLSLYFIYPKQGFSRLPASESENSTLGSFKNIFSDRRYLLLLCTIFLNGLFCGPLMTFCPVIIKNIFNGSARDLGWAMTALGIGGILGGIIISFAKDMITETKKFPNVMGLVTGLILILIAINKSIFLLYFLLLIAGITLLATNVIGNSGLQNLAGNQNRGRVVSLFQMALHSGLSLGGFITGAISTKFGILSILLVNGILAMIFQAIILKINKRRIL